MQESILDKVDFPRDLKSLHIDQLNRLCEDLRKYVVDVISNVGGHLAPSLGVVELTVALHYVFDTPKDKIVWDVGHQAYIHKILTGRKQQFPTIRQHKGLSGFPKISESEYDSFGVGHSSTAISAALGMACARDHNHDDYNVVAVVGDGALSGGIAFEGLNNAGTLDKNLIVILNDNRMSISPNVGALAQYLTSIITAPSYNKLKDDVWELTGKLDKLGRTIRVSVRKIQEALKSVLVPGVVFEKLGFRYFGPVDGHNLQLLLNIMKKIKTGNGPILLHVLTKKGKGYLPAEQNASVFHGLGAFNPTTGEQKKKSAPPSYTSVFGKTLLDLAKKDKKIIGITAAMADGTGLNFLQNELPDQFYDVGIAEQHAVTFACGMALQGMKPVIAIYSTFLQRAFDQLVHDVGIQKVPIVFALDRAGLVGADGPTHHGVLDISYLRMIPNFIVMAPKDEAELRDMLWTAIQYKKGPVAIRYPRGCGFGISLKSRLKKLEIGKSETVRNGSDVALLGIGNTVHQLEKVAELLAKDNVSARLENMRFVKPLDEEKLTGLAKEFSVIVTFEDNTLKGGFGSSIREFYGEKQTDHPAIISFGLPDQFVEHGDIDKLFAELNLTPAAIAGKILSHFNRKEMNFEPGLEIVNVSELGLKEDTF